ncbi:hypothetical protein MVES_001688 [Malassezia vespertilionis]|uniref:HSF-type DNA-binding domain-containing protein n=2 Tax=Malassezia vespertilionis TaxID=2020962 RepID=A0A2N1JDH9_9BASI|nr:hypothetical protein MVES_001688 [Malassezia vespertilionis]
MEKYLSSSPIDLPTPPDDGGLLDAHRGHRHTSIRDNGAMFYSHTGRIAKESNRASTPRTLLHRAPFSDLSRGTAPFQYSGFRPFGFSHFQMSAERHPIMNDEPVEDTEITLDDVFAQGEQLGTRAASVEADVLDNPYTSPALGPQMQDGDEVIPPLEPSYSSSSRTAVSVPRSYPHTSFEHPDLSTSNPDAYARQAPGSLSSSAGSHRTGHSVGPAQRRASLRQPIDTMTPMPGTSAVRRSPYNVPNRSAVSFSALSMTPSNGASRRFLMHGRSAISRRPSSFTFLQSSSAPSHHSFATFAADETDDDDATEDEGEAMYPRRTAARYSRSPSPTIDSDWSAHDGEYDAYVRLRHAPRDPYGYARGMPLNSPYTVDRNIQSRRTQAWPGTYPSSLPSRMDRHGSRSFSTLTEAHDDAYPRAQVHMAAAALDRLSMVGPPSVEADAKAWHHAEPIRHVAENDEVTAIRDRLGGAANCSAFISKLWHLMINPELYGKYIHWNEAGDTIILNNDPEIANEFAAEVLPKLFKHGNNASFVRQLNLYGFQRVSSSRLLNSTEMQALAQRGSHEKWDEANGANGCNTAMELYGTHSSFTHPRFRCGHEEWLAQMKPRSSKKPKKPHQDASMKSPV